MFGWFGRQLISIVVELLQHEGLSWHDAVGFVLGLRLGDRFISNSAYFCHRVNGDDQHILSCSLFSLSDVPPYVEITGSIGSCSLHDCLHGHYAAGNAVWVVSDLYLQIGLDLSVFSFFEYLPSRLITCIVLFIGVHWGPGFTACVDGAVF